MTVTDGVDPRHLPPCDLVMKGGITSGLVYPGAAAELGQRYRFVNIGGTSVGAIAASVIAAAEYGRQTGKTQGWSKLEGVRKDLMEPEFVRSVFQPMQEEEAVFDMLLLAGDRRLSRVQKIRQIVTSIFGLHPRIAMLAFVLVLSAVTLGIAGFSSDLSNGIAFVLFLASLLLAIAAFAVSLALAIGSTIRRVIASLERNDFGFCTGMRADPTYREALTEWLHRRIQDCAGLNSGPPLTFRMLHELPSVNDEKRKLNLEMITTNLSYARPERLPFPEETYRFNPHVMLERFPEDVVRHMVKPDGSIPQEEWGDEYWMPGLDLPIVVGARFSLSFPGLFSANKLTSTHPKLGTPMDNWFSDGGITSNFPVHFFDSWFPGHPTFGLDLQSAPGKGSKKPDTPFGPDAESDDVYLPSSGPDGDQAPHWTGINKIGGFAAQIKDAMENWRDSAQAQLPGSRDRICQIRLHDGEGGLNLDMDPKVIECLIKRGEQAGKAFDDFRFDAHRWVRYLTLMQLLQTNLEAVNQKERFPSFAPTMETGLPGVNIYLPGHDVPWCDSAVEVTYDLLKMGGAWRTGAATGGFDQGDGHEPTPTPVMRATPRA